MPMPAEHLAALLLISSLVAGSSAWAMPPPRITISAVCSGGTPDPFAVGAMAQDIDGAVFRIEPGSLAPGRKVARNVPFVARLRETLDQLNFEQIRFDHSDGSWCGVTRTIESASHSVRWPTRLQPNGALAHHFAGMPVEVWHVFLELQRVGTEQQVCGRFHEDIVPHGVAMWSACQGPGINPSASGVYVLEDGDIVTWTGGPVVQKRCSRVAGSEKDSLARWHAMLSEARFEQLRDQPHSAQYGYVNCSIGRTLSAKSHVVDLSGVGMGDERDVPRDPRWKTVLRVFKELGAMNHPTTKEKP